MARYLRIRNVVKADRPNAHEQIQAICGIKPDGSHWSLTQDEAIAEIADGISLFYVERGGGRRRLPTCPMKTHDYARASSRAHLKHTVANNGTD